MIKIILTNILLLTLLFTAFGTSANPCFSGKLKCSENYWKSISPADISQIHPSEINARGKYGYSPIHHIAAYSRNPEVIAALVKAGANAKTVNNKYKTPLHRLLRAIEDPQIIEVHVKAGANVNARDSKGKTPLHYAASDNENPAIISTLVKLGADIKLQDEKGRTPLSLAKEHNTFIQKQEIIKILMAAENDSTQK